MNWIQLLLAVIALTRELIKWINQNESDKRARVDRIQTVNAGLRKARDEKDTAELELVLNSLGIVRESRKDDV